jgi:hypothetical protein
MRMSTDSIKDLEEKTATGKALTRPEVERVLACPDLISVGMLGEAARKVLHGDRITFGRVCEVGAGEAPINRGEAGEVRLTGKPASIDDARARVREAAHEAERMPLTGFSLADFLHLSGGDHLVIADLALALKQEGLEAVAEVPLDELGDAENAIEVIRAVLHGGLGAWRATISHAPLADRLALIERAALVQQHTSAFRAFAPLPRHDPREQPSTGYDDVRTIAAARLLCRDIAAIQVDWPLYGPKLAQVAITYGADDIDGIAGVDPPGLGHRRSPREEIGRHIRMAFAEPVERNGRYELVS